MRQLFEAFSSEFNLRLSQEMNSMMSMMHSQINRAITTAIAERVIPEIQNIANSIHSIPNLERQQSTHNISLDTTLPAPDPVAPEPPQDPFNRLADVLVNLQNKPQSMTIRPVQTTPMTFDGKARNLSSLRTCSIR